MYSKGRKKGTIRFAVRLPEGARKALLAGDFTGWQLVALRAQKGTASTTVELPPGAYQYKLVIDGTWVTDPDNDHWSISPIGTVNSVAVID